MLSVTPATVRLWANKGLLCSTTTPGGHRRFERSQVEEFANRFGLGGEDSSDVRVLVVDDERRVADYIARQLRDRAPGMAVRVAYGGLDAGFEINDFRPNVIIVDLMMPEVDGVKVCELAKRNEPSARVIAITGFTNTPEESAILEAGAEACLYKPVDLDRLLALVGLDAPAPRTAQLGP
jgi:CheY-like chemotaxis protein